jgi:hypothetical protein
MLIGSYNIKLINWPLVVVITVHPGKDGITRVARVKTAEGTKTRPFLCLYPLEVSLASEN